MKTNNISKNLKYLRKKKGLTQLELRTILGYTRSTWSNYENGITNPSIDDLITISHFLGVTLDDLIMNDLEAREPLPDKVHTITPPRLPVIYANNDVLTATAEPEIAYLLKEVKKIREDIDMIKEGKKT
jgi:transcriptional regulator with XRE-family HTH domain